MELFPGHLLRGEAALGDLCGGAGREGAAGGAVAVSGAVPAGPGPQDSAQGPQHHQTLLHQHRPLPHALRLVSQVGCVRGRSVMVLLCWEFVVSLVLCAGLLLLVVGCLVSQHNTSVSKGWICSDKFMCCHTDIEVADQSFYLTK